MNNVLRANHRENTMMLISRNEQTIMRILEQPWKGYGQRTLNDYLNGVIMTIIWTNQSGNGELYDDIEFLIAVNRYR